jgi:adenylate kinase
LRLVFIGPPGAGKGTQCARLVNLLKIPHLSTGEMLRTVKKQDSALSRWVASYIDAGKLAPDHLVMRIVSQRLKSEECANGALFDGFPRTLVQAQLLDDFLAEEGTRLDMALELKVDEEELIQRILKRAQVDGRADDNYETIRERLNVFKTQTAPLTDFYSQQGKLEIVNGMQSPDKVFEDIKLCVARHSEVS